MSEAPISEKYGYIFEQGNWIATLTDESQFEITKLADIYFMALQRKTSAARESIIPAALLITLSPHQQLAYERQKKVLSTEDHETLATVFMSTLTMLLNDPTQDVPQSSAFRYRYAEDEYLEIYRATGRGDREHFARIAANPRLTSEQKDEAIKNIKPIMPKLLSAMTHFDNSLPTRNDPGPKSETPEPGGAN